MKFNTRAFWLAAMFGVILIAVTFIGYEYRVNLMTLEINKYGGHVIENRAKKELLKEEGKVVPGLDKVLLLTPTEEILAQGKQLFDINCFSCHGTSGKGDGPVAVALNPKPRNFFEKENWKNGNKVSNIFRSITKGLIETGMPGFDYMSPLDRLALTHYVRSFNGNLPLDSQADLAKMDKEFNLTAGSVQPNTIPVELAASLMIKESQSSTNLAADKIQELINDQSKESILFKSYVVDINKAVNVLLISRSWRNSQNDFQSFVSNDLINNGFKVSISKANQNDIAILFDYALKISKNS